MASGSKSECSSDDGCQELLDSQQDIRFQGYCIEFVAIRESLLRSRGTREAFWQQVWG